MAAIGEEVGGESAAAEAPASGEEDAGQPMGGSVDPSAVEEASPTSQDRPKRVRRPTMRAAEGSREKEMKEQRRKVAGARQEKAGSKAFAGARDDSAAGRRGSGKPKKRAGSPPGAAGRKAARAVGSSSPERSGAGSDRGEEESETAMQLIPGNHVVDVVVKIADERTKRYATREYLVKWLHSSSTWEPLAHFPNTAPVEQFWKERGKKWKVGLATQARNGTCRACEGDITFDTVTVNELLSRKPAYHLDCAMQDVELRRSLGDVQELVFLESLARRYRRRVSYNWKLYAPRELPAEQSPPAWPRAEPAPERKQSRKRRRASEPASPTVAKKRRKEDPPPPPPTTAPPPLDDETDDETDDDMDYLPDDVSAYSPPGYSAASSSPQGASAHSYRPSLGKQVTGRQDTSPAATMIPAATSVHTSEFVAAAPLGAVAVSQHAPSAAQRSAPAAQQVGRAGLVPFNPLVGMSAGVVNIGSSARDTPAVHAQHGSAAPPQPGVPASSSEPLAQLVISLSERMRELEARLAAQAPSGAPSLDSIPTNQLAQELSRRLSNAQ